MGSRLRLAATMAVRAACTWHLFDFPVIRMVPTIAVCPSLSRKCRSHAACQQKNSVKEQEDRKGAWLRFVEFVTLSDKNLVKLPGEGPWCAAADRAVVEPRDRHDLHRSVAEKTFVRGDERVDSKLPFVDRKVGFSR